MVGKHLDTIHELIMGPVGTSLQLSLENDWDPEGSDAWFGSIILQPLQHAPSAASTPSSE